MEGILGFTVLFAGNFAPRNWALCDGSLLSVASNPSLFAVIGNVYGGDGIKTFALPDLRGRAIIGSIPGNADYQPGKNGGIETVRSLNKKMIPDHTHAVHLTIRPKAAGVATASSPENNVFATNQQVQQYEFDGTAKMAPYKTGINTSPYGVENPQPVPVLHPVLALNYIICTQVPFPDRNH